MCLSPQGVNYESALFETSMNLRATFLLVLCGPSFNLTKDLGLHPLNG